MSETSEVTIHDNPDKARYEASTESGVVAGFSEYRDRGDLRIFLHTEVDDAFEGQGVGTTLARGVLDDVRARGMAYRIKCPFIKAFVERHPEYADGQA